MGECSAERSIFGVLNFGLAVGLAYYAFVHVHAGFGQIVFALVPLAALLLAALQGQERITVRPITGAALALGGVALTLGGAVCAPTYRWRRCSPSV